MFNKIKEYLASNPFESKRFIEAEGYKVEKEGLNFRIIDGCPCGSHDGLTLSDKIGGKMMCFNCNKAISLIDWLMDKRGLSNTDAAKAICEFFKIEIPVFDNNEYVTLTGKQTGVRDNSIEFKYFGKKFYLSQKYTTIISATPESLTVKVPGWLITKVGLKIKTEVAPPNIQTPPVMPEPDEPAIMPPKEYPPESKGQPQIQVTDRSSDLRQWATEFFHAELMTNTQYLNYQLEVRKHSAETLKKWKVGLGVFGRLRDQAKKEGIEFDGLIRIGLMYANRTDVVARRNKLRETDSDEQAIIHNRFVYPHFSNGKVIHFTFKDPFPFPYNIQNNLGEAEKSSIKKEKWHPDWITYNQDALMKYRDIIWVEGENSILSVTGNTPFQNVVILNNIVMNNVRRFIKKNGDNYDRHFLMFDNDMVKSGRPDTAYVRNFGHILLETGKRVLICRIPGISATIGEKTDPDDLFRKADRHGKNPEELFQEILNTADEIDANYFEHVIADRISTMLKGHGNVIGMDKNGDILTESGDTHIIQRDSPKDLTNWANLVRIFGSEILDSLTDYNSPGPGKIPLKVFSTYVINTGRKKPVRNPLELGQGIHVSVNDLTICAVNGDDVWLSKDGDGVAWKKTANNFFDGMLIQKDPTATWIDFRRVITEAELCADIKNRQYALSRRDDLFNMLRAYWSFRTYKGLEKFDGFDHKVLTGLILNSMTTQYSDYRAHGAICGGPESGKTMLATMISDIYGKLALVMQGCGLTEASVRQSMENHACIPIIDEWDKCEDREKIMNRFREANRFAGSIVRIASQHQKYTPYWFRHSLFMLGIDMPVEQQADNSRIIKIYLKTMRGKNRKIYNESTSRIEGLRPGLYGYALAAAKRCSEIINDLNLTDRRKEMYAGALAMFYAYEENAAEKISVALDQAIELMERRQSGITINDEDRIMDYILGSRIKVPEITYALDGTSFRSSRMTEWNLFQVIEDEKYDVYQKEMAIYGVGVVKPKDQKELYLFVHPTTTMRFLFKNTEWDGTDIQDRLLRIPGSFTKKERLFSPLSKNGHGTGAVSGVLIPFSSIFKTGKTETETKIEPEPMKPIINTEKYHGKIEPEPMKQCFACKETDFYQSEISGAWICRVCHPPVLLP